MTLGFSDRWREAFPAARVGLLELTVPAPTATDRLDEALADLEGELRRRHAGRSRQDLVRLPVMSAYIEHYRRFGKTYHVLLQLEAVLAGRRGLTGAGPLVSAMFAAELDTFVLTAAHDLDRVRPPLLADVTGAGDVYTGMGEREVTVKDGDLAIRDREGILSSVIYGPDHRTRVTAATTSVLFTAYLPPGVDDEVAQRHLGTIERLARLASPGAETRRRDVHGPPGWADSRGGP